jgi:enamine deaminase RidA (YjgF/YER057c/UK114 family)
MTQTIEMRLSALGIVLPVPPEPVASYLPTLIVDDQLYVSGQLPMGPHGLAYTGKLGAEMSLDDGIAAARLAAINILAQAKRAVGTLNDIRRLVSIRAYVASTPDFIQHPKVVNGASLLMIDVFAERGQHTRTSVGVASLPMDAAIEIEAQFAV